MAKLFVSIDCRGVYCGRCACADPGFCRLFDRPLTFVLDGHYLVPVRLVECTAAESAAEGVKHD